MHFHLWKLPITSKFIHTQVLKLLASHYIQFAITLAGAADMHSVTCHTVHLYVLDVHCLYAQFSLLFD